MRVEVTKCFLVQVMDEKGNEIECEYLFCNTKEEAKQRGMQMKEDIKERLAER